MIDTHVHYMDVKTQKFNLNLSSIINKSCGYAIVCLAIVIPLMVGHIYLALLTNSSRDIFETVLIISRGIDIIATASLIVFCGSQYLMVNHEIKNCLNHDRQKID